MTPEQEAAARDYLAAACAEQAAHQAVKAARKRLHAAFGGNIAAAGLAVARLPVPLEPPPMAAQMANSGEGAQE